MIASVLFITQRLASANNNNNNCMDGKRRLTNRDGRRRRRSIIGGMAVPLVMVILAVLEARQKGRASDRLFQLSSGKVGGHGYGHLHYGSSVPSILSNAEMSAAESIYIINSTSGRYDLNNVSGLMEGSKDRSRIIGGPRREPFDSFFVNHSAVEPYDRINS